MNELDDLENVYFGKTKISEEKELAKLKGLYEYVWMLKPPKKPAVHAPYNLLVFLAKVAPKNSENEYIATKLREYGYIKEGLPKEFLKRIDYAFNWVRDFEEITEVPTELSSREAEAIRKLVQTLQKTGDENEIQTAIFTIAKEYDLKPSKFFQILYAILLGAPQGPRLGPYIVTMGRQNVIDALTRAIANPKSS
jgi:lysyl-tRNA synthetase class 1